MIVKTRSGSTYEFLGGKMRRVNNAGSEKRMDGEWLAYRFIVPPTIGSSMIIEVEQLNAYGPDDHGNEQGSVEGGFTQRVSTPVEDIWA